MLFILRLKMFILIWSLPLLATSYRVIPKEFRTIVKLAIDSKLISKCPKPVGEYSWIFGTCVDRIIYNSRDESKCSYYKDKEEFASCIGFVGKSNNNIKVCNRFKDDRLNTVCVITFSHYSTVTTDHLDHKY